MKALLDLKLAALKNKLSHANLLIGGDNSQVEKIIDYIVNEKKCLAEDISILKPEQLVGKKGEIKIEEMRELLRTVNLTPNGKSRVSIIYDCDKLNKSSGNILLKSLEEPPSYLTYILTTRTEAILPTIKSRCRVILLNNVKDAVYDETEINQIKEGFHKASAVIENIVKDGRVNEYLFNIENFLREKMLEKKNPAYCELLEYTYKIKSDIAGNANQRLALECLYLKIRKFL